MTRITLVGLAGLVVAGCGASGDAAQDPHVGYPPAGFRLVSTGDEPVGSLTDVVTGGRRAPVDVIVAEFESENDPHATLRLSVVNFEADEGALGLYNAWFAEVGFMAAAEREPLNIGDQAERYDVGWPTLHAVIAREGPVFVLVEASDAVPEVERDGVLAALARDALARAGTAVGDEP